MSQAQHIPLGGCSPRNSLSHRGPASAGSSPPRGKGLPSPWVGLATTSPQRDTPRLVASVASGEGREVMERVPLCSSLSFPFWATRGLC